MISESAVPSSADSTVASAKMTSTQLTAWLLCVVLGLGIVVSGAYMAMRILSNRAPVAAVVAAAPIPAPIPAPAPAPTPAPAPLVIEPVETPAALELGISAEETKGLTFLQAGAIERSAIRPYLAKMARAGITGRAAEGPDANTVRILVGPVSGEALTAMRAKLEAAGFACFARSY
jgi:hypothetical protein